MCIPVLKWALAAGIFVETIGCSRSFYRKQVDKEVSEVLADKDKYAAWKIENFHVYPDPRARYGDPSDPDHPPKPPDDPAAYDLSPNPQRPGKAGVALIEGKGYLDLIAKWDRENRERLAKDEADSVEKLTEPPKFQGTSDDGPPAPPDRAAKPAPFIGIQVEAGQAGVPDPGTAKDLAIPPLKAVKHPDVVEPGTIKQVGATNERPGDARAPAAAADNVRVVQAQEQVIGVPSADLTSPEVATKTSLDVKGRPTYRLTLDQAAELAMFNSREYQDQRENLYLAALPVTLQRFSFTSQLFAASEATREYAASGSNNGKTNSWSINSGTGLAKVLPTGALLLLNFSNQTVVNFLNPKSLTSVTNLNFSAVQPLLQGGGQAVALENLTQAERNLLYQIRTYARFRKQLYVEVASNSGGSISGSTFQPTGVLSNGGNISSGGSSSGVTVGVLAPTSTTITGPIFTAGNAGALNAPTAITPPPSGYLNTMLESIQVYIDKENVSVLSAILQRYRGLLEGDVVGPLQVQNVEQQLLTGRATLITDQQQYLDAVDAFKIALGVPVNLNIEMDDSVLRPLMKQYQRSRAVIEEEQAAVVEASKLGPLDRAADIRTELKKLFQTSAIVKGTKFAGAIRERWASWERLSDKDLRDKLEAIRKEIRELQNKQADLQKNDQFLSTEDNDRLKELGSQSDLGNFEHALRKYEADYTQDGRPKKADPLTERKRVNAVRDVISLWQKVLVEARDERWRAIRQSWPELPRCCVNGVNLVTDDLTRSEAAAAQYALENRFDLMNVRGQVVDAWRQLAVFANALLGVVDVGYNLNSNSPVGGSQPLLIGGSGNAHSLVLNTQLPLVRIQQRNNYRIAQIAYQRNRRALQEAEDLTVQRVRSEIHLLRLYAESYKIQQRQLELAYLTIDSALEALQAPTAPGPARGGDGPAALTQQLLNAQRFLPTSQNALLTIWINYLDARLQLYRDLELMPLDARGVWIDEIRDCDCGITSGQQQLPQPSVVIPPPREQQRLPEPQPLPGPDKVEPR